MGLHVEDDPDGAPIETVGTPRRAGRYLLGRVLGRGAMGVVRASYDPALDREVAVKLIAPGDADAMRDTAEPELTRSQRIRTDSSPRPPSAASIDDARLLAEARALASVAHPNIVEVFDVGVCDAGVFIAMELVDGVSLRTWNGTHRPDWRTAVELHLQAGEALAAAHRVGIVHGDFKPDNVLVRERLSGIDVSGSSIDEAARVKVVDFGLARAMGRAEPVATESDGPHETRGTAMVFGTPAYLAPECWGDPHREPTADQFAFFVALFEAITGRRPYARVDSLGSLLVQLGDGPQLDALHGRAPAQLRRAIARGLDPDPTRRFASMAEVLAELRAVLVGEQRGRTRRWLVAGVLVLALPTAAIAGGLWLRSRWRAAAALQACADDAGSIAAAWNDDVRARAQAAFVAAEPRAGSDAFARVTPWLDEYASTWSSLRGQSCTRALGGPSDGIELARAACFAEREASLAALVEVLASADPEIVRDAVRSAADLPRVAACDDDGWLARHAALPQDASARERVTAAQRSLARADQLLNGRRIEEALALVDEAAGAGSELAWTSLTARAQATRGRALMLLGRYPEAEVELEAAYFHAREADDETSAAIAAELASLVGTRLGHFDDGLVWARHAETALASLGGPESETHARLAVAQAAIHVRRGDVEQAIAPAEHAREIRVRIFGPDHPSVAAAELTLGSALGQLDRVPEAIVELDRAREIFERALGEDHPQLAGVYHNLGMAELELEHYGEARAWMERSLAIRRRWLVPDHPDLATSLAGLAYADLALDRYDDAQRGFSQALAMREAKLGPEHPAIAETLSNLARVASKRGDCREAARALTRATTIMQNAAPQSHRTRLHLGLDLGDALLACHDRSEALAQYQAARTLAEREPDSFRAELARAQAGIASAG